MFSKILRRNSKEEVNNRVVIIGTGSVGASAAFALMIQGIASEIVLIDADKNKSEGESCDLEHGLSFVDTEVNVRSGDYKDCKEADVVVICAGAAQKPGQSRLDLTKINSKIIKEIVTEVSAQTKEAIILMVTNPLDVLTHIALKTSKFPRHQVFGTGTTLDSSRFRHYLAEEFNIATDSMGAYLLGEHGDSSVPVYSHANVMGEPIRNLPGYTEEKAKKAYQKSRDAAAFLIQKKGFTCYGIALAISRIVRAILYNENHVFPLSVNLQGEYGLKDITLSVPAVVGRSGIKQVLDVKLTESELLGLKNSAEIITAAHESLKE